ncbi:MAG: CoA pyrophosphatase [Clostridium sp.]|uniref:NUDIX hydrolase n=1 Tax=Clostridium cuniculi TaxID=2548455 RepID=UPI0010558C82|nr:CoA pyrophosphatase [Clostridium cuniculi]MDO5780600.1 CoA pyrophosphatase [Clostridium sp.]
MIDNINNIFSNYTPYINGWEKFKRASVTIPLVNYNNSLHILFEVRAKTLRTQPNEVCFPGGKIENDENPLNTAIRETCEEIGICEDKIKIISPLDIFVSPFNTIIHPYLVFIEDINTMKINVEEVEKVFFVPLDFLLNTNVNTFINKVNITPDDNFPYDLIPKKHNYKFSTGSYEVPFYIYNEYVIWGITAKILLNFLSYLKQRNYHN